MQKWEYLWMSMTVESGSPVFVANGHRLSAQNYAEALNLLGQDGWELVSVIPPAFKLPAPLQPAPQFCLKRPLEC